MSKYAEVYENVDTGLDFTLEELEQLYKHYKHEMNYHSFEEFIDDMTARAKAGTGGLIAKYEERQK